MEIIPLFSAALSCLYANMMLCEPLGKSMLNVYVFRSKLFVGLCKHKHTFKTLNKSVFLSF